MSPETLLIWDPALTWEVSCPPMVIGISLVSWLISCCAAMLNSIKGVVFKSIVASHAFILNLSDSSLGGIFLFVYRISIRASSISSSVRLLRSNFCNTWSWNIAKAPSLAKWPLSAFHVNLTRTGHIFEKGHSMTNEVLLRSCTSPNYHYTLCW